MCSVFGTFANCLRCLYFYLNKIMFWGLGRKPRLKGVRKHSPWGMVNKVKTHWPPVQNLPAAQVFSRPASVFSVFIYPAAAG